MTDARPAPCASPAPVWGRSPTAGRGGSGTAAAVCGRPASGVRRGRLVLLAGLAVPLVPGAQGQILLLPPVAPACISSPFGWRRQVGPHAPAGFHNGVDLPAPAGAIVRAALPGTVLRVRRQGLGGVTVHLGHPGGPVTLHARLGNLVPALAEGKRAVAAGEPLGRSARTGVTYGTHLFFAVLRDGQAADPEPLLGVPRCK